jgi:hypothetical protein
VSARHSGAQRPARDNVPPVRGNAGSISDRSPVLPVVQQARPLEEIFRLAHSRRGKCGRIFVPIKDELANLAERRTIRAERPIMLDRDGKQLLFGSFALLIFVLALVLLQQ